LQNDHNYYVYILANQNNRVLYIGVTNSLERRLYEHKNKIIKGFTHKYNIDRLLYFEHTNDINVAIACEKQIKSWRRDKKNQLIATINPDGLDLSIDWCTNPRDSSVVPPSE
jgi:putative endonuclease